MLVYELLLSLEIAVLFSYFLLLEVKSSRAKVLACCIFPPIVLCHYIFFSQL